MSNMDLHPEQITPNPRSAEIQLAVQSATDEYDNIMARR